MPAAVQFVRMMHFQFDPQRLHGLQERLQKMFGVTGMRVARAGNVAQRLADVRRVALRVEEVVHPPQRIHAVGHVIQLALGSLLPQRADDAFRGQHLPQVTDVVLPRRRYAGAQEVPRPDLQKLTSGLVRPMR